MKKEAQAVVTPPTTAKPAPTLNSSGGNNINVAPALRQQQAQATLRWFLGRS